MRPARHSFSRWGRARGATGTGRRTPPLLLSALLLMAAARPGIADPLLTSVAEIMDASRGVGRFAETPASTTFIIADGTYAAPDGLANLFVIRQGGTPAQPRRFQGQSRSGVVIRGRAVIEGADHVEMAGMTFDLTDYQPPAEGSFGTMTIVDAGHIRLDGLTLTGAGRAGKRGGHIETDAGPGSKIPHDIVITDCLIENFGRYDDPEGRLDHGIYLSAGRRVRIEGNTIRNNAGRGIQLYGHAGAEGILEDITIVRNRIERNGRFAYTDGIVVAVDPGAPTGSIRRVHIRDNLFLENAFAGIRFACDASDALLVEHNTFWHNGAMFARGAEIFIDDSGGVQGLTVRQNAMVARHAALRGARHATRLTFHHNAIEGPLGDAEFFEETNRRATELLRDPAAGDFGIRDRTLRDYGMLALPPAAAR